MPDGAAESTGGSGLLFVDGELVDAPPASLLASEWPSLSREDRRAGFESLPRTDAGDFFLDLPPDDQASLLLDLPDAERRIWLRLLAPDDAADVIQDVPPESRDHLLSLLDPLTRSEVVALLAYAEDDAGGKMSPRYARLRPEMTAGQAISYLRRHRPRDLEMIYYVYVLDDDERLLGVVSFRDLFAVPTDRPVVDIMRRDVVAVREDSDQEEVADLLTRHALLAVPVVDAEGRMKGIVTSDDVIDVMREEATEDIHKLGGLAALDVPYLRTSQRTMISKRAGWLAVLFLGQMLTASAIGFFEGEIAQALVLVVFVPLVISSGGNAGSQAATLVIRAMSLGEVRLTDGWLVVRRELYTGLSLGAILALLGLVRILSFEGMFGAYGDLYWRLACTVALSLLLVVTWGAIVGSMLPFALRRLNFDPASASAPMVATLSDVTGLVIYFTVARFVLLPGV
ncbi:MAG: magnesium transporter [Dehalococcoidia bacterium]